MKSSDFDFQLLEPRIAQHPAQQRDESRLMVVDRRTGNIEHARFKDLTAWLDDDDLLVINNTRVFAARLFGRRPGREERIEVLLLGSAGDDLWEVLVRPGRKVRTGTRLFFDEDGQFSGELVSTQPNSPTWRLRLSCRGDVWSWLERLGETPLPPYIRRPAGRTTREDRKRYQTVFARVRGSVAAPTAGLHFTTELLSRLHYCEITLHVGYGTFRPVTAEHVEEHRMDPEFYEVSKPSAKAIRVQKAQGKAVTAVGTTTTRCLESVVRRSGKLRAGRGWTELVIYPPFQFRVVDHLITNFHLPGSSLLFLVSAFAGRDLIRSAYREAVARDYRFYSYGDAMLIL